MVKIVKTHVNMEKSGVGLIEENGALLDLDQKRRRVVRDLVKVLVKVHGPNVPVQAHMLIYVDM